MDIFVFGSNLQGIHKSGAALEALNNHGAILNQGIGLQGFSYAIPTKKTPWISLNLIEINKYVAQFLSHAIDNPQNRYLVTKIGCGLAGYSVRQIAPMFRLVTETNNVKIPTVFSYFINEEYELIPEIIYDFEGF